MPQIDLSVYEKIPFPELEAKRRALVEKARGQHDNLEESDLRELAAITGILRRKASGPPKEAKKASTPRAKKAGPAALDDLA